MRTMLGVLILAAISGAVSFAADAKAGQAVYDKSCKSCHGMDGTPNASIAKMMKVDMRDLRSPEVQSMSDSDLGKIITAGQGKMKPVASVTGADVGNVVAYVRALKAKL